MHWDGDRERIVMQLDMRSDSAETGLVVPTPTPATVTAGDPELFEALTAQTEPEVVTEYDWWGPGFGVGAGGAPDGAAPTVLDRVQLGPIEAVTLAASDTVGLQSWLTSNGFALSDALLAQLGPYVDEGWSFVALRITSDAAFDGALDPITFTFESDVLVYPMRMSRAAETPQSVRLYVLDEHRAAVSATEGDLLASGQSVSWAGPVDEPALAALGEYLTVIDLAYDDPATQVTSDLALATAPDDTVVQPPITRTEIVQVIGIPLGPLLVGLGVLLLLVGFGVVVARSRRT